MGLQKDEWSFRNLAQVQQAANVILHFAMFNERSKRWPKVVESYKRLLWLIDSNHFPRDYEPPASNAILMYEVHYHLGVALQRLGQHRKALTHFTKATQAVSIPKGGCLAGCVSNSCLMTPIYARTAFAHVKIGDLTSALRDAEKAVVLDNQNPDVYCIRALVRGSREEDSLAVADVDAALKLNASHVCAMLIRGALSRTLAERLSPASHSLTSIGDFNHLHILDFFDRFLYTLSVPHTVTHINLTPDKPSKKNLDSNPDRCGSRNASDLDARLPSEPFRCGTLAPEDNKMAARRRRDYGDAVRKFMARPKTASEFLADLERRRKRTAMETSKRASSANVLTRNVRSSGNQSHPSNHETVAPLADVSEVRQATPYHIANKSRPLTANPVPDKAVIMTSFRSVRDSCKANLAAHELQTKSYSGRITKTTATKTFTYETPVKYNIPVFQPMNIKDAPRMYYRPWRGDKLPIADVKHRQPAPAFY